VPGLSTLPKFEYDSIAARGSTLNRRARSAVWRVTSVSTSASGSVLTVVSAQKTTRLRKVSM
jgi:hypothetical protein